MKRHLSGAVAAVAVASGVMVSACDVAPPAATANGTTISVASLNSELHAFESTQDGGCLLQLQSPQLGSTPHQGAGGPGTYTTTFAAAVLESQVGELLAEQYATAEGLTVSSADLTAAKTDLASTLSGEIEAAVQQSTSEETASSCETASGSAITGAQLLQGLPVSLSDAQVMAQAYDEKLLADGANLSEGAVVNYYTANKSEFTTDCVSRIVTSSEGAATQVVAELNAGAPFAALARSSSIDTQTAANGGSLGCTYTQATIEQELGVQSISVGRPLAPLQDSQTGQWYIYEVTSQSVEPLPAVSSVVRRELLQTTSNVDRVSKNVVAFAHRSDVSIDPQYGSWNRLSVIPPVAPPPQYLLGAVSGSQSSTATSPLTPSGSAGSGR